MMELYNGELYWDTTLEREGFEARNRKEKYDVAIIGGGMSGALCSYVLSREKYSIVMIEQDQVGSGSTSANTGLLQFSNDIMLHELMEQIGEKQAVEFYRSCKKALQQLQDVAENAPLDVHFHTRESLYYASTEEDVGRLRKEYDALKKHGFPVEFWDREEIEAHFPFTQPAAIVTDGDAEVNPLRLCIGAIHYAYEKGMDIFEQTKVLEIKDVDEGSIVNTTNGEFNAQTVIVTTGYAPTPEITIPQKDLKVTYAIATQPIADLSFWHNRMMIWETKRPYLYMRLTNDQRIVAGGLDQNIEQLPSEEETTIKFNQLKEELSALFPQQPIEFDYEWTAVFGESTDELPVVGRHPEEPNIYYLIGLGGNGTVYSMLGAYLIRDEVMGKVNPNQPILEIER
ncbi:FAD-dependent oxidoreductase [Sporosarcina sp. GW1-11]|uniref:NAD(P)/FAD-dependent oxidoreductase n=1 Tax=Sporosarcina sp. GW1-11 TaxID=2899126 RepID=UPI00294D6E24|nr:FAD-dependent oxidoreductase [Sporosarcina sp. GW1-11]MDV6379069.1 FAD-dependent oxidoreductase [Sporosarcina sp. GW1-11]